MTEWDDERASITGRPVTANVPPPVPVAYKGTWKVLVLIYAVAALIAVTAIVWFKR